MSDLRETLGDNFPNRLDWGYRWPGCRWRWGWLWAAWRWPGRPRGRCACPAAAAGSAGRGRPGGPGWPHLTLGCWSRGRRSGDIGFLHQHADEVTINNEWFILSSKSQLTINNEWFILSSKSSKNSFNPHIPMPEHNKMKHFREVPMFPHNSIAVQECFRVIKTKQMIHRTWK